MKKFFTFLLTVMITMSTQAYAAKVTGHIYKTDITAYENYLRIPSYNISGTTVVFARDLENYGYDILWNSSNNTVEIKKNNSKKMTPILPTFEGYAPKGTVLYDIYESNIKVYHCGRIIPSYNIGGKIAVKIRDLDIFCSMIFSATEKTALYITSIYNITDKERAHCMYFYKLIDIANQLEYDLQQAVSSRSGNTISDYHINMINASHERLKKAKTEFTSYAEPSAFTNSTNELWWAIVNADLAAKSVTSNKKSFGIDALNQYQRYHYDSLYQKQKALNILSEEISLKEE